MPFGLANALAACLDLMNRILCHYLDLFVVVFIDDILVYSRDLDEHVEHLYLVLRTLQKHNLYAKVNKCELWLSKFKFGSVITQDDIVVNPNKVGAELAWSRPTSVHEVRNFL